MSTDADACAVALPAPRARVVVDDFVVVVERDDVVALVDAGAVVVATTFTLPLHATASAASARRAHLSFRTRASLVVRGDGTAAPLSRFTWCPPGAGLVGSAPKHPAAAE